MTNLPLRQSIADVPSHTRTLEVSPVRTGAMSVMEALASSSGDVDATPCRRASSRVLGSRSVD